MSDTNFNEIFTRPILQDLMPAEKSAQFFEALYGDANEGAYTISLSYAGYDQPANSLHFELHLNERPGKCLSCNLTYGLPDVFARHPLINIKGLVQEVEQLLSGRAKCGDWKLGFTKTLARDLHAIPLTIQLTS